MYKSLLLILLLVSSMLSARAYEPIAIDSECIMLEDIFPDIGIKDDIFCGLDYGEEKTINRQMSMFIINKYNIAGARAGEVTFKRRGKLLTEDRFKSDIQDVLSVMYGEIEIEIGTIRMGRPFYYSEEKGYDLNVPKNRFGNVSVAIDNGQRKFNYTVNLKAFKDIYVAKSTIRKGHDIGNLVALERYDLSKVRGESITDTDGLIASRNISAGRPVTTGDVMKKPDALEGSSVAIVFNNGQLNVTTGGELQENAYIGKNVRVKNTTSGKIVRGKYMRGRKVLVNFQ